MGDKKVQYRTVTTRSQNGQQVMLTNIQFPNHPPGKTKVYYDGPGGVPGFGLRITGAGFKTFILVYRVAGVERRMRIGSPPQWTIARARDEAKKLKRAIDTGEDPQGSRAEARGAPDVKELCERYIADHLPRLRPASAREYKSLILTRIIPEMGTRKVAEIEFQDVDRLHQSLRKRPYRANRCVSVLSLLFALAIKLGWRETNPAKGIDRYAEEPRNRYLSEGELEALLSALDGHPDRQAAAVIKLLILTGARKGEVLGATWPQFDLAVGIWTKPSAHTKQRKIHIVPLSEEAIALLQEVRATAGTSNFVFPGAGRTGHLGDIKKPWKEICKAASIDGLRVHDLRHSFASFAVSDGESLETIGALLGHSQASTTSRYSHLMDAPQRRAAGKIGKIVANAKGRGKVVSFQRG
jgi:integrase